MTTFLLSVNMYFTMNNSESDEPKGSNKSNVIFLNLGVLVFFLVLVFGIYYWVSKKSKGEVVFPAGVNYLSPNTETPQQSSIDYAKLASSAEWLTFKGKIYGFSFQYPKGLLPLSFPNDSSESVTFKLSDLPPELNLMFLVETISSRDANLVGKHQEFTQTYWKYFAGLKGVSSFKEFTNEKGLEGYQVKFSTKSNTTTTDNYFFKIPGDNDHMLHIANIFPKDGQVVFERILNSIDYKK